ncbi:hypothetical protein, partial [Niabella yanshanensis]
MIKKNYWWVGFLLLFPALVKAQAKTAASKYTGYLFTYFTGNSKEEEAIRFAISTDGYHFQALNNNQPVIASSAISATGGV